MKEIFFYEIYCTEEEANALYTHLTGKMMKFNLDKSIDYFHSKVDMDCVDVGYGKVNCILQIDEFDTNWGDDDLWQELTDFKYSFKEVNEHFSKLFEIEFSGNNIFDMLKCKYMRNRLTGIEMIDGG